MSHFVVDVRVVQDHFPGIGRYAWNLVRSMPAHLHPNEMLTVLWDPDAVNTRLPRFDSLAHANLRTIPLRRGIFTPENMLRALPVRGDVQHHTYYVRPPHRARRTVTTVYDAIPFIHPELFPSARTRLTIRLLHALAVLRSDVIVTISRSAADDLARLFPAARGRIVVTPLAADPEFSPPSEARIRAARSRFDLPARFVFYLGSNKPHKNLSRLLEAWRTLGRSDVELIVAGHVDPRYVLQSAAPTIRFVGPVGDADAAALYGASDAFVFPSLYEGFGLTPLEAMSCGAPVICSNTSSLPEVVGEAALLVDPLDVHAIAAALARVLDDPALRAELRARSLRQAWLFSWDNTAAATLAAYRG